MDTKAANTHSHNTHRDTHTHYTDTVGHTLRYNYTCVTAVALSCCCCNTLN